MPRIKFNLQARQCGRCIPVGKKQLHLRSQVWENYQVNVDDTSFTQIKQ